MLDGDRVLRHRVRAAVGLGRHRSRWCQWRVPGGSRPRSTRGRGHLRALPLTGYLRAPRSGRLSAGATLLPAICRRYASTGNLRSAPCGAHRGPIARDGADGARKRDGRYRGGGPVRRSSGEWWEGAESPLKGNVRTRRSRSWPVKTRRTKWLGRRSESSFRRARRRTAPHCSRSSRPMHEVGYAARRNERGGEGRASR